MVKLLWRLCAVGLVVLAAALLADRDGTTLLTAVAPRDTAPSPIGSVAAAEHAEAAAAASSPIVASVIDGDTIRLADGRVVRLIGIDAPEARGSAGRVECFAAEATTAAHQLLIGQHVRFETDLSNTDRYGRLLRYAYVGGAFINERLVREGFARAYAYPPDTRHAAVLKQAEREAREAHRGIWGSCGARGGDNPNDRDCGDFRTRAEATAFFLQAGGPAKDPHDLDSDGDGIVCESLPG